MSNSTDSSRAVRPTRVLVSTATHLVPGAGKDFGTRISKMVDIMCQHVWGCNAKPWVDRYAAYGAEFAYDNRRCFFLLDRGVAGEDEEITQLWYEWDGWTLEPLIGRYPSAIRSKLKRYPFKEPRSHWPPVLPRFDDKAEKAVWRIRHDWFFEEAELEWLKENPEVVAKAKKQLEPHLWFRLEQPYGTIEVRHYPIP